MSDEQPARRVRGVDDSDEEDVADVSGSINGAVPEDSVERSDARDQGSDNSEVDSSEEDEDDDEEELTEVRKGFIVDDDADDDDDDAGEGSPAAGDERKRKRLRKSRESEAEPQELDQDDLDLVREAAGVTEPEGKKFKRLKRSAPGEGGPGGDLTSMFNDEDEEAEDAQPVGGEFDDFIEEDEVSDEEELRRQEERETQTSIRRQKAAKGLSNLNSRFSDLDEDKLGEIYEIFGDGEMYDWALEGEEEGDQPGYDRETDQEKTLDLHDVFEPSELAARMLTSEDNDIRSVDIPERYQLMRQKLKHGYELTDEEFAEKKNWIVDSVLNSKNLLFTVKPELREPLKSAVQDVVEFVSVESWEVPFIWHNRQDYLQEISISKTEEETVEGTNSTDPSRKQLLTRDDLWKIVNLDMDFHFLLEKRKSSRDLWDSMETSAAADAQFEDFFNRAKTIVDYQDIMDWIQFEHSTLLRGRGDKVEGKTVKRHSRFGQYDRIRASEVYDFVKAVGISADKFADNVELGQRVEYVKDPAVSPVVLAAEIVPKSSTESTLSAAEGILVMEIYHQPKIRSFLREEFQRHAKVEIILTEDGKKKIDDNSPFSDIKYAKNWSFDELRMRPDYYLRMLAAEQQGLVIVRVQYPNYKETLFENTLVQFLLSDNVSDVASEWNDFRRRVFKGASRKIIPMVTRNIREDLRADCLNTLALDVRKKFSEMLDQAPYKPPGFVAGTIPRVLAISPGMGDLNRDAVLGAVVDEDGHLLEHVKFGDPRSSTFRTQVADLVQRRKPDVIGIAGFGVETRKVMTMVSDIVTDEQLTAGEQSDAPLEILWVQDEVARIYRSTKRATVEYPDLPPMARYCIGLARYMQSPLLEYAALGDEIDAIQIHPYQHLLRKDQFKLAIESAFVDYVNLDGVDINVAAKNPYIANLVPYVSGLGPRKSSGLLQAIQNDGGTVSSRADLVTKELMGKIIWVNCASFFKIPQESTAVKDEDSDPLDATRIHPEDYNLARKMAADALELDEEDIEAYEANGPGGVVAQLFLDDVDKLEELVLEDFAATLEKEFHQKKLLTLETIRSELKDNYKELRKPLRELTDLDVFTMLTGETKETIRPDAVVSAVVRKATNRQLITRLSSGIDAVAESGNISDDRSQPISALFTPGQAVQAVILTIDYKNFYASINTRAHTVSDALRRDKRSRKVIDPTKWNSEAESRDMNIVRKRIEEEQRQGRIIKHPLFRLFNAKEAEEYLAPLQRGDLVIRPSSRGHDHITITWKVGEMLYQHVDVLEIDKPNEYTLGRYLQVGPWRYSDLDELIIMHIQAMARKVDEMIQSEKFQAGSKADVDKWLTAYTNARPKQSVYAFCFDHRRPGYFLLCYKTGASSPVHQWHVKVIPNGYELMKNNYPDVPSLSNGFKTIFQNMAARR